MWVLTARKPLVPVALIAYEIFARPIGARNASNDSQHIGHYLSKVIHSRFRYMVPMAMMTMGAVYFYTSIPRPRSSFICAQASPYPISIPILQIAGTVLDTLILTLTYNLVFRGRSRSVMPSSKDLAAPGWALLVSAQLGKDTTWKFDVDKADLGFFVGFCSCRLVCFQIFTL